MNGTLINAGTVLAGTTAGIALGDRLPDRVRETVMHALGLVTILVGIDAGLAAFRPPLSQLTRAAAPIVMGAVLFGGILGEGIDIERRLSGFGDALKRRFSRGDARFTEGFVVASLVFCVGPMTIVGSIQDGLTGDYRTLAIKAMLDGFASLAFASVLGIGVGFSIITILVYQGGLTLAASSVAGAFSPNVIAAITGAGGIIILGVGLRLLSLKEVRVGNLLPALVLAPVAVALFERLR